MYIPKSFAETDAVTLYQFMRDNNFASLVTGNLVATHLPFLVDTERGVLRAHLARANDQWKSFDGREALVIFTGPHAYVTPTWYDAHPSVPTWNYTAVHVYGVPYIVEDEAATRELLRDLVENHEQGRQPEWQMALPEDYLHTMIQAVVAFELPMTRVEGKFKLSQNRSEAEQQNVATELSKSPSAAERATGALMESRRGEMA